MKAVISLSGGLDSAVLLADLVHKRDKDIIPVSFFYGSKHNNYENEAAAEICRHYGLAHVLIDASAVFSMSKSNLLKRGGEIPEGHYNDKSMKLTVVPARNMIFISILTSIAVSYEAEEIYIAVHAGDHAIYPDCRPDFISSCRRTVALASDKKAWLYTPFLDWDKAKIVAWGASIKAPFELTRTCYKDQPVACGRCGSCNERLEAFTKNMLKDPIEYTPHTGEKIREGI
jgi:7-cyano-7-deazaguanine synthase